MIGYYCFLNDSTHAMRFFTFTGMERMEVGRGVRTTARSPDSHAVLMMSQRY